MTRSTTCRYSCNCVCVSCQHRYCVSSGLHCITERKWLDLDRCSIYNFQLLHHKEYKLSLSLSLSHTHTHTYIHFHTSICVGIGVTGGRLVGLGIAGCIYSKRSYFALIHLITSRLLDSGVGLVTSLDMPASQNIAAFRFPRTSNRIASSSLQVSRPIHFGRATCAPTASRHDEYVHVNK